VSRLFVYSNQGERSRFRIDSEELLPWAIDLHSCAIETQANCAANAAADLAWSASEGGRVQIELNGAPWETPMSAVDAFFQSENLLTQLFASTLNQLVQIHSATVRRPGGGAWMICGPSRSGKTSVTLSLMLDGWSWMTDELTLVSEDAPTRVKGFRRNFNLKEPSWERFPETKDLKHARECWSGHHQAMIRFIDPEMLRPNTFVSEAGLEGILLPEWMPEVSSSSLDLIPGVGATQVLMPEIKFPSPAAFRLVANWMQNIPVYRFQHSDPRKISEIMRQQTPWTR